MRRCLRPCAATSAIAVFVACSAPALALAQQVTTEQCMSSYTSGQRLRAAGQLSKARDELLVCASDSCPTALRSDCSQWVADVQKLIPSVVLGAQDESGHDVLDVDVYLDSDATPRHLDGRAIDLDPGPHVFRFQGPGKKPVEMTVLVREGEKARPIVATMHVSKPEDIEAAAPGPSHAPVPTATWILGGVAIASFGACAYFFFSGLPVWNRDHEGGGSSSDQDFVNTRWHLTDVTAGLGLASAAVAAYFYFSRPTLSVTAAPAATAGGGSLLLRGTF
jgi:hypothetical protein